MPHMSLPLAACLVAALLFGASTPASKALLAPMGPVVLAGLLYLGAALGVLPAVLSKGWQRRRVTRANLLRLAGAVVFGGVLGPLLLLAGLSLSPSASVALWLNLETAATSVLARLVFREDVGPRTWAAAFVVLAACVLLASPNDFAAGLPALLVAAACACWGLDNNLTSLIDEFTPAETTFVKGVVAGGVNLCLGLALGRGAPGPDGWPGGAPAVAGLLVAAGGLAVGAVGYGLSLVLYVAGAQRLGAVRSQMAFATAPFFGLLLSWAALGEPVSAMQVSAGGAMLAAVWFAHREQHAHRHVHRATRHIHSHDHDDPHHQHDHPGLVPGTRHTHEHDHGPIEHEHPHRPDVHHRHDH